MNVVELFSGIGAQAKSLENIGIDFKILHTCDWDINAIIAYDLIHNGPQDLTKYDNMTLEDIDERITSLSISSSGKSPLSYKSKLGLDLQTKKCLLSAIDRTHNLVDITAVKGEQLPSNIDVLTYSFPCQDLSLAGNWHNNQGGIDRNANNRSSLLWQVERILTERQQHELQMPNSLLMENVTAITSDKHAHNFEEWKQVLIKLGYINRVFTLDATDFGSPQKRKRTFMISFYVGKHAGVKSVVENHFLRVNENNIYMQYPRPQVLLQSLLRTDYNNAKYYKEALESNPNDTVSRRDIYKNNLVINDDTLTIPTITTKQDRHPNSGVIDFDSKRPNRSLFRYLTPRECFMLMGFDEKDYDAVVEHNFKIGRGGMFFTRDKLNRMAGNSICVNVLESIFLFINDVLQEVENIRL